jgi:hypothetical protein
MIAHDNSAQRESVMAIKHLWESSKVLHILYTGNISGEELLNSALEISGSEHFDSLRHIIADWREAGATTVTLEDVEALAAYIRAMTITNPNIKNVSIMNQREENQALVTFYASLTKDSLWQVASVKTMEEARQWLESVDPI